jgi:hypothetical protein
MEMESMSIRNDSIKKERGLSLRNLTIAVPDGCVQVYYAPCTDSLAFFLLPFLEKIGTLPHASIELSLWERIRRSNTVNVTKIP